MTRTFFLDISLFITKGALLVGVLLLVVFGVGAAYDLEDQISDGQCNIAVLPLDGVILPYQGLLDVPLVITPELVEDFFATAEEDPDIDAVLLEINSPGGTPVASERIAERLRMSELPVIGMIGDQGASGGYMIAAATDYLLASAMSDIGSIGVDMSYVEETEKNEEEGLTYVQLTTGQFKDIGSPNRAITEEERERLLADLDVVHQHFIDLVSEYRNIDREQVVALADGSTMPGARAVENGLIDAVGGRSEARLALAQVLNSDVGAVQFCEYEPPLLPF
jgi:protease-4